MTTDRNSPSEDSSAHEAAIKALVEKIPTTRPVAFRYDMEKFKGNRDALHAAILKLLEIQTSPVARVHTAMVLMCVGHPLGGEVLLATLRTEGAGQKHALGELSSMWSYDLNDWAGNKEKLPITAAEVAKALLPLLGTPETKEGLLALEFCLQHACTTAAPFVIRHLDHPDLDIRWKVVGALLDHGINEGALATVLNHFLGPIPTTPEPLAKWRRVGEIYGSHLIRATEHVALQEPVERLALDVVKTTLSFPDATVRTWFNVDHRTGKGYFNHMLGILGQMKSTQAIELLKAVVVAPNLAPMSKAQAARFVADASGAVPEGAESAIVAMVQDKKVSEWGRGPVLRACAKSLRLHALTGLIVALDDGDLRREAAQGLGEMQESERDPEVRAALEAALRAESRDWVAEDIADALLKRGVQDNATVDALMPWLAMDLRWKQQGIAKHDVARELTAAGAIDPMGEAALDAFAFSEGEHLILGLLTHGSNDQHRLVVCSIDDPDMARHDELFVQLAKIARPPLQIESLSQSFRTVQIEREARSAGLQMWQEGEWSAAPDHLLGDTKLISVEEEICTVRYSHAGRQYSFEVETTGAYMDVDGVVRAFNQLLERIARPDRVFRMKGPSGDDRWALLLCAHESKFVEVAERLHIPLLSTEEQK